MIIALLLTCLSICLGYVYLCRRYVPAANRHVPILPGKIPVFGHALMFLKVKDMLKNFLHIGRCTLERGGVALFYAGPYPMYFVSDPEDIATVLQKCLNKMFVYKLIEPLVGKMLLGAEVPVWKRSRRIVDLGFKQNLLDQYLDLFNKEAENLAQTFAEVVGKGEVDLMPKINKSFLEATVRTSMGSSLSDENIVSDSFINALETFLEAITVIFVKPWHYFEPLYTLSGLKKKIEASTRTYSSLTKKMVKLRKEEHLLRLKNGQADSNQDDRFRSFLDVLIENTVTETGSTYEDSEMINLVDNVLLAAFDTTISEITVVLICIGSYREVQDKIYKEITTVLDDESVTKDNHTKLVYLEAVIKEAIRLYPIGPIVARETSTELQLRNTTLPAGSSVVVHIWAANRHPDYWGPDAAEFKPERWLGPTLPEHPFAFSSFAPGRRGCPGKIYTLMYFKATLVALIRRYRFTGDHSKLKFSYHTMIKPMSGHKMTVELR